MAVVCAALSASVILALKTAAVNKQPAAKSPVFPEIVVNDTVNETNIPKEVEVTVTELATEERKARGRVISTGAYFWGIREPLPWSTTL